MCAHAGASFYPFVASANRVANQERRSFLTTKEVKMRRTLFYVAQFIISKSWSSLRYRRQRRTKFRYSYNLCVATSKNRFQPTKCQDGKLDCLCTRCQANPEQASIIRCWEIGRSAFFAQSILLFSFSELISGKSSNEPQPLILPLDKVWKMSGHNSIGHPTAMTTVSWFARNRHSSYDAKKSNERCQPQIHSESKFKFT